ncbi:MAG: hypothetical protein RH917_20610 [Lacipirellulaceae bacterium]
MKSAFQLCRQLALTTLSLTLVAAMGCGESSPTATSPSTAADRHDHPSEGPHHGSLIELGSEEYHAELVHDDAAGTVTIYLLDSAAIAAVPVDSKQLQINLSHDGEAEQFELLATSDVGDPPGRASKFVSSDAELVEELDHEGVQAQLVVSIGGKQYRGAIEHDHDHEGHDH